MMKNKYASYIRFNHPALPWVWIRAPRWLVSRVMRSDLWIDTHLGKRATTAR